MEEKHDIAVGIKVGRSFDEPRLIVKAKAQVDHQVRKREIRRVALWTLAVLHRVGLIHLVGAQTRAGFADLRATNDVFEKPVLAGLAARCRCIVVSLATLAIPGCRRQICIVVVAILDSALVWEIALHSLDFAERAGLARQTAVALIIPITVTKRDIDRAVFQGIGSRWASDTGAVGDVGLIFAELAMRAVFARGKWLFVARPAHTAAALGLARLERKFIRSFAQRARAVHCAGLVRVQRTQLAHRRRVVARQAVTGAANAVVARCSSGGERSGVGQEAGIARAVGRAVLVGVQWARAALACRVWIVESIARAAHAGRGVGVAGGKGVFVRRGAGSAVGVAQNLFKGVKWALGTGVLGVIAEVAWIAEAVTGGGRGCG